MQFINIPQSYAPSITEGATSSLTAFTTMISSLNSVADFLQTNYSIYDNKPTLKSIEQINFFVLLFLSVHWCWIGNRTATTFALNNIYVLHIVHSPT